MSLARNTTWNLAGQVLPLALAVVVIPILLRRMGTEGFGLLTIVWTLIGYFNLFDFGLGRALTNLVSQHQRKDEKESLGDLVLTGLILILAIGLVLAFLLFCSIPWAIPFVLKPRLSDPDEIGRAFQLVAFSVPFVLLNVGFRAVLEGQQRFDLTNLIRLPFGLFMIGSPAMVLVYSGDFQVIVAVLCAGISFAALAYATSFVKSNSGVFRDAKFRRCLARRLAVFGGWVSISNFLAPMIFYVDRFIISAILSVAVMAYYVTPYEVITKTLFIASAIAGALFPAFSRVDMGQLDDLARMVNTGVKLVALSMFPILVLVACLGFEMLNLWVGPDVATHGTRVLQVLAVGVFFNGVAYMPYTLIQARGRPDWTARLHLFELPIYVVLLWMAVVHFGLVGAAYVWAVRALVELIAFLLMARQLIPRNHDIQHADVYLICGLIGLVLSYGSEGFGLFVKISVATVVVFVFLTVFWIAVLDGKEKLWVKQRIGFAR